MITEREYAESILEDHHSDRVFTVEDDVVWVSGMNANCRTAARNMAQSLLKADVPCGPVHDDGAVANGGVQFRYGEAA
jgi:hypothetical protein